MILNAIWVAFILIGFLAALVQLAQGDVAIFTRVLTGLFDTAKTGFDISLGLVGVMSLWLGTKTWAAANAWAYNLVYGSFSDWRLSVPVGASRCQSVPVGPAWLHCRPWCPHAHFVRCPPRGWSVPSERPGGTDMHPLIETHRAELLALARRRGVTGVRVFGSMSRGDGTDNSDVDLLVTLAPGTSALALGGLLLDAQELLGRRVDVVTEASLHPALRERVMALAVPL